MPDDADRVRLGRAVRERRNKLGMSLRTAVAKAKVSRPLWTGLEEGTRATREHNFAAIEEVLLWPAGEMERILNEAAVDQLQEEEIIEMDYYSMARHAIALEKRKGKTISDEWLAEALRIRANARQKSPESDQDSHGK